MQRHALGLGLLAVVVACGTSSEDLREVRDGQRELRAKMADIEKKIDQLAARPAAAPQPAGQPDPNRVYNIPVGDSPTKGPAAAPVVLAEFSDFQ